MRAALHRSVCLLLCGAMAFAATASELDTTMHAMPKPGAAAPACPACPAVDADDGDLKSGRARDPGAPEYAVSQQDEASRLDGGADVGVGAAGGAVPLNPGGLIPATVP